MTTPYKPLAQVVIDLEGTSPETWRDALRAATDAILGTFKSDGHDAFTQAGPDGYWSVGMEHGGRTFKANVQVQFMAAALPVPAIAMGDEGEANELRARAMAAAEEKAREQADAIEYRNRRERESVQAFTMRAARECLELTDDRIALVPVGEATEIHASGMRFEVAALARGYGESPALYVLAHPGEAPCGHRRARYGRYGFGNLAGLGARLEDPVFCPTCEEAAKAAPFPTSREG